MGLGIANTTAAELFGVPAPPPRNARDKLVRKAIDLFYTRGFNAIGIDRIISEVGVTKTTFYKHFESKDDLMIAALRQRDEWETLAWTRAIERLGGDDPRAELLAFFDVLDVWFNDPSFGGCIFINAAAEFPDPADPIHKVAAEHKRKAWEQYRDLATRAGASEPGTFADQFTMLFEGTLIMRHVHGRNDAARLARDAARRLVDEFMPQGVARDRSAAVVSVRTAARRRSNASEHSAARPGRRGRGG
jgi:AcrR family transcriptional regulator